MLILETDGVSE